MGTQSYRANLSSAIFPMNVSEGGRTVIIPGPDQNFDRRVDPTGAQKDAGIPQALYLENCIPTVNGYQSVGYKSIGTLPGRLSGVGTDPTIFWQENFDFTSNLGVNSLTVLFRSGSGGYVDRIAANLSTGAAPFWQDGSGSSPVISGLIPYMTRATVRNLIYLFDGTNLYAVTNPLADEVIDYANISGTLTGILATDIICIAGSFNYLIAVTESDNRIHWSSTTTATDFVDSLVTGAGSQDINNLNGKIRFIRETPQGFNIYTTHEVIYAQYTGNARYPWKFTPVANADGFLYPWQVTSAGINSTHYAISNSGKVFSISGATAELISVEVSSYVERATKSDAFNSTTNVFSKGDLVFTRRILLHLKRYILLEYTVSGVKYFLIFDILNQRYGKLKQEGYAVSVISQTLAQADIRAFFLKDYASGNSYQLGMDTEDSTYTHSGVLALGKFQYVRPRFLNLLEVELEGPAETNAGFPDQMILSHLPSLDGRNFDFPSVPYQYYSVGGVKKYYIDTQRMSAQNHTLVIKGRFNLSTVQLRFFLGAER